MQHILPILQVGFEEIVPKLEGAPVVPNVECVVIVVESGPILPHPSHPEDVDGEIIAGVSEMSGHEPESHPDGVCDKMHFVWKQEESDVSRGDVSKDVLDGVRVDAVDVDGVDCLVVEFVDSFIKDVPVQHSVSEVEAEVFKEQVGDGPTVAIQERGDFGGGEVRSGLIEATDQEDEWEKHQEGVH